MWTTELLTSVENKQHKYVVTKIKHNTKVKFLFL